MAGLFFGNSRVRGVDMPDIQHKHEIEDIINLGETIDELSSNSVNPDISLKDFVEGTLEEFESDYVKTVKAYAFHKLTSLKKVVLGVANKIEANAFDGCTALETLVLSNENEMCTLANTNAFTGSLIASGKGSICVPIHLFEAYKNDKQWSKYADVLQPLGVGENIVNKGSEIYDNESSFIRECAFYRNTNLHSATFEKVTNINKDAFFGCNSLTTFAAPLLEKIEGGYAFGQCSKLSEIDAPLLHTISASCFSECNGLTSVNMPELKSLPNYVFDYCKSLKRVSFPSATTMGSSCFYRCVELEEVNLPKLVAMEGDNFSACTKLSHIDFPSLTEIPERTFSACTSLKVVVLRNATVCSLGNINAFNRTPFAQNGTGGVVLVPSALVVSYKTATNWSTLYGYGTCEFLPLEEYTVDGTITGEVDGTKVNDYFNTPSFETMTDRTTGVSVSALMFPFSTLTVSPIATNTLNLDTTKYPLGQNTIAYDISLTKDGKEYTPEYDKYVELPESLVPFNFAAGYVIYNVCGDNVEVRGPIVYTGGFINMPFENEIGTLIYSDVFPTASNESFEAMFSKNNVTLYEAPFESAKTHKIENGLDITIYPEFSYTDTNGVTWCEFYNDNLVNEGDLEYLYVKAEDTEKIVVDGPM